MIRADWFPPDLTIRQKVILCGLYLSKFDSQGLSRLGFDSFTEAFNVIGLALNAKPASVKNYRDEFDPFFPNERMGWHKRPIRTNCQEIFDKFQELGLEDFCELVKSFFRDVRGSLAEPQLTEAGMNGNSSFAQRLVTGLAAERYFQNVHSNLEEFKGFSIENTTLFGCGYDFRLRSGPNRDDFLAVEVKGLMEKTGNISMTPKEYDAASYLTNRFFLFVVKNFKEAPFHTLFRNPVSSGIELKRIEKVIIQVFWSASI